MQMDPDGINLKAIASGHYDPYLSHFAEAVRAYGHPVILSFGHEMNGNWYSWGYRHTSPAVFVAAWRHIVTVFPGPGRAQRDVAMGCERHRRYARGQDPEPCTMVAWPGIRKLGGHRRLLLKPSWAFAPLFAPTIDAVGRSRPTIRS